MKKDCTENATERPWSINKNGLEILARTEAGLIPVANLNFGMNPAEDAALIVRAVNSFDALVEALEELLHGNPDRRAYEQAETVLKLAKGE